MKEIAIYKLDDLKELDDFISQTNEKSNLIKGIVVADDGDIKAISANIRDLKQREDILKIAEQRLIKLAGIDRVGSTIANSRKQRSLANKNVQNAKQEIKNKALDFFISSADKLIQNSKASNAYKQTFNTTKIASETIYGKSKNLMGAMKIELSNLVLRLNNNARETSKKLAIIKKCDDDLVRDLDYLLSMPVDTLKLEIKNREIAKDNEIEAAAQKLADEKMAVVEAERIEAERIEAENKKGDWYCPECKNNVDATYSENCNTCGAVVLFVQETHIAVPIKLIEAVGHIGVDTGYGVYELDKKWIKMARDIYDKLK